MVSWQKVAERLELFAREPISLDENGETQEFLDEGQRASVAELARRIRAGSRATLLADEVGMGKTRIAVALIEAVRAAGGRSIVVLPPGLGVQWQAEIRRFNRDDRTLLPLRSYDGFIWGFFNSDDSEGRNRQKTYRERQNERRRQLELPERGWSSEAVLMISHSFASMRFPRRSDGPNIEGRRELLPTVARLIDGRRRNFLKDNFSGSEVEFVLATRRAAEVIAAAINANKLPCELRGDPKWLEAEPYKQKILPLIGYGLGKFDLVVIDEAHKARGVESSLSRILGPVIWESKDRFCLGMTATPVELDATQWIETLSRIGVISDDPGALSTNVKNYIDIVQRLQAEELDEALTSSFEAAARSFYQALEPFVLRRDKRHDPEYRAFENSHGDYRQIAPLAVAPGVGGADFSRSWLRRFCAAEALSMLPEVDTQTKMLRLGMAKGYSLDAVANDLTGDSKDFQEQETAEESASELPIFAEKDSGKSVATLVWRDMLGGSPPSIYTHPAILDTVRLIEEYTGRGEKVLVFGRFIKPLAALTRLLDAREMLRRIKGGEDQHWPARSVRDENREAVCAAMRDVALWPDEPDIEKVNGELERRYRIWVSARRTELEQLRTEVRVLAESNPRARLFLDHLEGSDDHSKLHGDVGALLEALESTRSRKSGQNLSGKEAVELFGELLTELASDRSALEASDTGEQTQGERLKTYLNDFSGREGNFARMIFGATAPQTRRTLQAAFNRSASWPMVLLAQSRVGREGLNLHSACKTVILLHAEWNPGVVEQQIGRVDRKNSLWLKQLRAWGDQSDSGDPPRIHIHPVVVKGTYDDHNWKVLIERWSKLRAQLHGDVLPKVPANAPGQTDEKKALIERVRAATPDFSPVKQEQRPSRFDCG